MNRFKNIKVLVWDVDGTLYKSSPELSALVKKKEYEILARTKSISLAEAENLFEIKRKNSPSGTEVLVGEGCGSYLEVLSKTEAIANPRFIKKDVKLMATFAKFVNFRHLILANKVKRATLRLLGWLGLNPTVFERIFTIEDFKVTKPDPRPFKMVLAYTGLPPQNHLMIGDREKIDLEPAKKLGMKTCFVWGKSEIADLSLPEVYDILEIITGK